MGEGKGRLRGGPSCRSVLDCLLLMAMERCSMWQRPLAMVMVAVVVLHTEWRSCGAVRILASSSSLNEVKMHDAYHNVKAVEEAENNALRYGFLVNLLLIFVALLKFEY